MEEVFQIKELLELICNYLAVAPMVLGCDQKSLNRRYNKSIYSS